jgi:uncharacterized membrane protein
MIITVTEIASIYFLLLIMMIQNFIIYFILFLIVRKFKSPSYDHVNTRKSWILLLISGVCNVFRHICLTYSSSSERTPIIIQMIISSSAIIPTVFFSWLFLNKQFSYKKIYIGFSLLFLCLSLSLSIVPLVSTFKVNNVGYIFLYLFGILFMCLLNVLTEKYLSLMPNQPTTLIDNFYDKFRVIMYQNLFSLIVILGFFWMEIVLGYTNQPWQTFVNDVNLFFSGNSLTLKIEVIIIAFVSMALCSASLSKISSKYTIITTLINNPIVLLFFLIFPSLNKGVEYPLYIVLICLFSSALSVTLWILGDSPSKEISNDEVNNMDVNNVKLSNEV